MSHWETVRVISGYRRRMLPTYRLLAEVVYATMFSMRDAGGKTVRDIFPGLFNDDSDAHISQEDIEQMQEELRMLNGESSDTHD